MAYLSSGAGAIAVTATSDIIVAADPNRDGLIIQIRSGDPFALGIGEAAVYANGILLDTAGDRSLWLTGHPAKQAIYGICDAGNSAVGSYQELP